MILKKNNLVLGFIAISLITLLGFSMVGMSSIVFNPKTFFDLNALEPEESLIWGSPMGTYIAKSVVMSDDGYLYVVGYADHDGTDNFDVYIKKLDFALNSEWITYWGGSENDYGEDIAIAQNGDIVVVGSSHSYPGPGYQLFIATFDPITGGEQSNATLDLNGDSVLWGVDVGPDGRIYTCGDVHYTGDFEDYDAVYIIWNDDLTVDVNGVWLNGAAESTDRARDIKATTDWGFVIVGETESSGAGAYDGFIALYDWQGILVTNETWGGAQMERFDGIVLTEESSFKAYVAGWTNTGEVGWYDASIICYNSTIDLQWTANYTNPLIHDVYYDITLGSDDYLYATGHTNENGTTDTLIVKCDTAGVVQDSGIWGNTTAEDAGYGIIAGGNYSIFVCGGTNCAQFTPPFVQDAYLLKYGFPPTTTPPTTTSPPPTTTSPNTTSPPPNETTTNTTPITTGTFSINGYTLVTTVSSTFIVTLTYILYKKRQK
ncbi:MAG: hypothetical protein GF308_05450 [Candidatus Heimdallarchaeota archaeon]|nr:hypothetical protein [Candidatus Heimdallarchaeota archaeon]